jgi:hypothetical protein
VDEVENPFAVRLFQGIDATTVRESERPYSR